MFAIARKGTTDKHDIKRTLKYMSICHDPRIQREILRSAPDLLYKAVLNAIYNVANNPEINITERQRNLLKKHRAAVNLLVSRQIPLKTKRYRLQRGKGIFLAAILPGILSIALSALGSRLFGGQN